MHLVFADTDTEARRSAPPFWAVLCAVVLAFGGLGALIATMI